MQIQCPSRKANKNLMFYVFCTPTPIPDNCISRAPAEKLIQNLLPVVDSLEKALESSELVKDLDQDHSAKAVLDGVGLCHKMFLDTLGKENVAVVDPHGEPFDPNLHQAMSMVENPDMEPNSVVAVIQKGYQLNGRLVRPAMVMVSKGVSPSIDETV